MSKQPKRNRKQWHHKNNNISEDTTIKKIQKLVKYEITMTNYIFEINLFKIIENSKTKIALIVTIKSVLPSLKYATVNKETTKNTQR